MVKIIGNWIFASHLWVNSNPTPVAINLNEVVNIDEVITPTLGKCTAIFLKNDTHPIPIEGNITDILGLLQHYLISLNHNQ